MVMLPCFSVNYVNIITLRAWIIMSNIDIIDEMFYIFLSCYYHS